MSRYSTKYQDSIGAQIRKILEHAIRLQIYVPREFIFFRHRRFLDERDAGRTIPIRRHIASQEVSAPCFCSVQIVCFAKHLRTLRIRGSGASGIGHSHQFLSAQNIDTEDKKQWELLLTCACHDRSVCRDDVCRKTSAPVTKTYSIDDWFSEAFPLGTVVKSSTVNSRPKGSHVGV